MTSTAHAFPFTLGPVDGSVDTTVSIGTILRMEDADPALIGVANGGTARSVNDDDGNLLYSKGDVVSTVAKATQDLSLRYRDYGLFTRYSYFYDAEYSDNDALGPRANDRLGSDAQLLDLFVYGRFDVAERGVNFRLGRQVISWGESTFIQNGINVINPIDVARIRAPGSELKEALLPISALSLSTTLTDSLSAELVWLLSYDEVRIDPRRSFFSSNDFISDDGEKAFVGFGRRSDDNDPPETAAMGSPTAQQWVARDPDRGIDGEREEYGLALRYYAEALNNTEFGLYYLRYHSRLPLISGIRGGANPSNPRGASIYVPDGSGGFVTAQGDTRYFVLRPEGIQLYGLSFNTSGPYGTAIQGEYSYRPNLPVQLAATELLLGALGLPNQAGLNPANAPGTEASGFDRLNAHQLQTTVTKAFGPSFGAQQFLVLGEVGYNRIDLPDDGRLFNGPGASLPSCRNPQAVLVGTAGGSCQSEGYATRSSWGYRAVSRLDYENVIGAVSLSPRLVYSHDVNGVGPNFNQGTRALSVGLGLNFLQAWQADIGYTAFSGGRTYAGSDPVPPGTVPPGAPGGTPPVAGAPGSSPAFATSANPSKDRDFLSISVSYAF